MTYDNILVKVSYLCYHETKIFNLVSCNAPYFIILLCLTPDNFTCQGESCTLINGLINQSICQLVYQTIGIPVWYTRQCARRFYLSRGESCTLRVNTVGEIL